MRKKDLTIEYGAEILWLRRYFNHTLIKMINERADLVGSQYTPASKEDTILIHLLSDTELRRFCRWYKVIKTQLENTDASVLNAIKSVFVKKEKSVTGAALEYLHYSKSQAYTVFRKWFQELSNAYDAER